VDLIEKKCDAYVMKWHFYYEKLDYVQKTESVIRIFSPKEEKSIS
jgi:hypothetical protein